MRVILNGDEYRQLLRQAADEKKSCELAASRKLDDIKEALAKDLYDYLKSSCGFVSGPSFLVVLASIFQKHGFNVKETNGQD